MVDLPDRELLESATSIEIDKRRNDIVGSP